MRFYGREEELQTLSNFLQIVRKKHLSQMVVVTGRRRVGKTTLILKAFEKEKDAVPVFYFFVERRTTEEELVAAWLADVCGPTTWSFRQPSARSRNSCAT